jgi:hypothetical protein
VLERLTMVDINYPAIATVDRKYRTSQIMMLKVARIATISMSFIILSLDKRDPDFRGVDGLGSFDASMILHVWFNVR